MKAKQSERFSYTRVMKELRAAGNPRTVETYRKNGVSGDVFGVSYAFLKALDKRVASDQELAEKLWAPGNADARIFACWVADETKVSMRPLDAWCRDLPDASLVGELAGLAAYVDLAAKCSRKWRRAKSELKCAAGWSILGTIAMQPDRGPEEGGVTDEELAECLVEIEERIHAAPNVVRQRMNQALIAIGCRASMTHGALKVARRVGEVEIDHGNRSCKTPLASDTIEKTVAHYKAKGKKPTDGTGGKRRRQC